jgi:very-short-patch-repair endonuclease
MPNAEQWVQKLRNLYLDGLDESAEATESPIEAVMLWALIVTAIQWTGEPASASCFPVKDLYPGAPSDEQTYWVLFGDEKAIAIAAPVVTPRAKYRLDFALTFHVEGAPHRVHVAVECDGFDFHERTKEQAQRDKARDRDLQSLGWVVARFTGSEIIRDPIAAAKQVWQLAQDTFWLRNPVEEAQPNG